jgi:hypothetical protein
MENKPARLWAGALMMIASILAVCVLVPMGFMSAGPFARWLKSMGIHSSPNLAGGTPIAEFTRFERVIPGPLPGWDSAEVERALALRRFSVSKVQFRRWAGIGIAPRLNLSFEFDGPLPDPQNSPRGFSMTVIHVYIKPPDREPGAATSERAAKVDFGRSGWNYQVIIDGFHEQARIFDSRGNLIARSLGLYVDHQMVPGTHQGDGATKRSGTTRLTAALPLETIGDPAQGNWQFYLLAGISDSRHPSMMLHSMPGAGLNVFCGALTADQPPVESGKPRLRPLEVKNPS